MPNSEIFVYISLEGNDILVGKLWFHNSKGRESASFEYDKDWLNNPDDTISVVSFALPK
jgi:serine/threonine-protein kinase HipA